MNPVVLIIEDNEINMKLFRSLLNKGNYRVIEAIDAENGINLARAYKPDLILMDIQLPNMDGLQATRLIKQETTLKHIPILALTSHAMVGDDEKARNAGCDGYITKPINTRTFLNEISRFIKPTVELNVDRAVVKPSKDRSAKEAMESYKPKVLVVDDDPGNVKLICAMLATERLDILTARDGKIALEVINHNKIDLILLDIMMPGMDGYEVTKRVKENILTKDLPIILVTALNSEEDKRHGLDAGADEFITKPINKFEIISRVRSMLRLRQYRDQIKVRKQSEDPLSLPSLSPISVRNNTQNVLLVEDNRNDIEIIKQIIINEPYNLRLAATGEEAIDLAKNEKIDLILLDVMLPGIDGYNVCQHLKTNAHTSDIQIVMITSLSDLDSKLRGVEEGVDDFLVKPIDKRELKLRIAALLKKKAYLDELHSHREKALDLAIIDGLTKLYNQSYLKRYLDMEIKRAIIGRYIVGLIIGDLDNFKRYNDALGHSFGDRVLEEVAQIIKKHINEIDFPARYGGEEFAVVFPYADIHRVISITEDIRSSVEQHIFEGVNHPLLKNITISIGIAFCPLDAIAADELIEKADFMMYRAKKSGKNQICYASQREKC
ncbi:MAG: response regulator [Gammaproteobacteria bacterium]|nr:response regulator [Gammaproteobacteria bacterium]